MLTLSIHCVIVVIMSGEKCFYHSGIESIMEGGDSYVLVEII